MITQKTRRFPRFLTIFLIVLSTLLLAVLPTMAQDVSSSEPTEGLVFTLNSDNSSYSVTGYTGSANELVIPLLYQELPVAAFKQSVFADQALIGSVNKITFLSTTIKIDDTASTIPEGIVIEAYTASDAQRYAQKYNRTFSALKDDPYTNGLGFSLNEDQRSYTITRYVGTSTDIIIPCTYHGLPVTELKTGVFIGEADSSVTAPDDDGIVTPDDFFVGIPEHITILSKVIKLPDAANTFPKNAVIMGHKNSTAQSYATKYGRSFTLLPSILSAHIELGADITVIYKVDLCDANLNDAVMKFSTGIGTVSVKGSAVEGKDYYLFAFEGIGPHMISDNIRAELIVGGKTADIVDNYSVRRYCLNMLKNIENKNIQGYDDTKYDLLSTLIADLAEYGTVAQHYAGHNIGIPANRGITGASTYHTLTDAYMGGNPGKSTIANTYLTAGTMELSNVIKLRFSFATDDVSAVTVKIGNAVYDADDFVNTKTTDANGLPVYQVRSEPIYATHLEDDYCVSLRVDGAECQSMNYSVLNYICRKQNNADATLANLVKCIRNYGLSALNIWEYDNKVGSVALFVSNQNITYTDALQKSLQQKIDVVDVKTLDDDPTTIFDTEQYDVVIVAGIDQMSVDAKNQINTYMSNGGRLVTLGGPAFESMLYELDGKWYNRSDFFSEYVADQDNIRLLDLSLPSITNQFIVSSNGGTDGDVLSVGDYGLQGNGPQLFHEVQSLNSWNNLYYVLPEYELSEATEDTLSALVFYAKAMDDHTRSLYLEITDSNKSRWITSVTLSEDWDFKVVTPNDFRWWHDSTATDRTTPDFTNLTKICFGFARSGQSITQGHHSYAISSITLSSVPEIAAEKQISVDSLAPMYELYPITNGATLVTSDNQVFVQNREYALSDEIVSCSPGRQGLGFGNGRPSRFVPLIEVKDEDGLHSGYAAWMHLFSSTNTTFNKSIAGSMLACFSSASDEFYDENGIAAVVDTVRAMMHDTLLVEGGTDEFIYVAEDTNKITAGLSYVELSGTQDSNAVATVALYSGNMLLGKYSTNTITPVSAVNNIMQLSASYDLSAGIPDRAVTTLSLNGKVIDRIEQGIKFWEPTPEEDRHFVYIEDGQFKKNGQIVSFFGVNYMPSYGVAEPNTSALFEHYVSAASYDPDVIANDLARIKSIGMNSVSIFVYYDHLKNCNNILDLVQQCKEMGLYVDLSIRNTAYPLMNYNEAQVETLIRRLHFHENETIYAYDIAWEPRIGNYDGSQSPEANNPGRFVGRKNWDDEWAAWIDVQYGSLSHAQNLWGVQLEKTAEGYPYVSDAMLDDQTGAYDKVTAAYYRFIDDQVSKLMNEKMLHMQPLAPDQLISFRMSMSGSGLRNSSFKPSTHCFDFQSLASTMAYMEPEGYQLAPNDARALQIPIANAYARYVQPDSPIVWKEFGQQIWTGMNDSNFNPDNSTIAYVTSYYEYALEYMLNSYTSGVYAWYYAGGYRIGENSDYGILNPDGSDRPMTALLREYAPKFINQGARPEADIFIEVERDNQNGAIFGIYEAVADQARQAYDNGQFFDFVDANMDSANDIVYADEVYTAAVGGTATNGLYPLRYVNGMIKDFKVVTEGGKTYAEVTICNTKQSTWRANTVSIVSASTSDVSIDYTIGEDVDYLENLTVRFQINGTGDVDLRFEMNGVQFGPLYSAKIQ